MRKLLCALAVCGLFVGCSDTETVTTEKTYPAVVEKPAVVTETTKTEVKELDEATNKNIQERLDRGSRP